MTLFRSPFCELQTSKRPVTLQLGAPKVAEDEASARLLVGIQKFHAQASEHTLFSAGFACKYVYRSMQCRLAWPK